jgi:hypothetical protein
MGTTAEAIDLLRRRTTLNLKVVSWRIFFHGASREQTDDHVIEVRCRFDQPLVAGRIIVGTPSENLDGLTISIEIRSVQKSENAVGWLRYNPPISSGDGVVNEKTGSVVGCVFFRNDATHEILRLLALHLPPQIRIGVTVNLDPETSQMYSNRRWDGKEVLEIEETVIVVANAPVVTRELDIEEPPIVMIARTIASGVDKLTTRVVEVGIFVAVALVCILIELWHHR